MRVSARLLEVTWLECAVFLGEAGVSPFMQKGFVCKLHEDIFGELVNCYILKERLCQSFPHQCRQFEKFWHRPGAQTIVASALALNPCIKILHLHRRSERCIEVEFTHGWSTKPRYWSVKDVKRSHHALKLLNVLFNHQLSY